MPQWEAMSLPHKHSSPCIALPCATAFPRTEGSLAAAAGFFALLVGLGAHGLPDDLPAGPWMITWDPGVALSVMPARLARAARLMSSRLMRGAASSGL